MFAQVRARLGKATKEEKGFTLIELLAVIVILGIIAVIAIPMIGNIISKSKTDADLATARQVYDAARIYIVSEKSGEPQAKVTVKELQDAKYLETPIYLPSDKSEITATSSEITYTDGKVTEVKLISSTNATGKTFTGDEILKAKATATTTP